MLRFRAQNAVRLGACAQIRTKLTVAEVEGLKHNDRHVYLGVDQTTVKETQAPNRKNTWAPSQRPRADAMTGPLFDGIDLETQPRPLAAIELIAKTPIRYVHSTAVCDGNYEGIRGGVQGHPKIYINVEKPGIHACTYCGNRFADEHHKEHIEKGEITTLYS